MRVIYERQFIINKVLREGILKRDLPVTWAETFLLIAASGDEGVSMPDIGNKIGLAQGVVSRIVKHLGTNINESTGLDEGLNLFISKIDKENIRRRRVFLTTKGKKLAKKVQKAYEIFEEEEKQKQKEKEVP